MALLTARGGAGARASEDASAQPAPAASGSCTAAEYHQFDFWVGDWDVFEFSHPGAPVAHAQVTRILNGCVLLEDYAGADGHRGQSFSIFDASRKLWHQSWVTNRGELLVIEGGLEGTEMVLSGADRTKDGAVRQVRGRWIPLADGMREIATRSLDGGASWVPWFDLMFRRHPTAR